MISHWSDASVNYPLLPARGTLLNIFRLYKLKTSISRQEFKGKIYLFWILWFSSELTAKGFSKKIIMLLYYLCVLFRYIGSFGHIGSFRHIWSFGHIGSFQQIGSFRHNIRLFRHNTRLFRHNTRLFRHNTRLFRYNTRLFRHNTRLFRHIGSFQQIGSFRHNIRLFRHNTRLFRHNTRLFRHIIWLFLHIIQDVFDIWLSNLATFGKFNKSWPSIADSRDQ